MAAPRNDNVREKILDTAEQLLQEKSFTDISLAQVAAQAQISKGTLYYYYKSKGEIFYDLTDRYLCRQWDELIEWTEDENKDTSLQRLVHYVVERNMAGATFRMRLLGEAQLGDATLEQKLAERYDDFHRLISEKIAQRTKLPADYLTWLILVATDGMIIQKELGNPGFDADAFLDQSIQYLTQLSEDAQKDVPKPKNR